MPTGYTRDIYNGKEVKGKDFLLACARAFGACIEMRDEDSDVPIPEKFEVSDYHEKNIRILQEELEEYKKMTLSEAEFCSQAEFVKNDIYRLETIEKNNSLKEKYLQTLSEVEEWSPPTKDHEELKKFAIDQLEGSIEFDCSNSYLEKPIESLKGQEWLNDKIKNCIKDIEYHTREQEKEVERNNGRNQWIRQLRESLK